MYWKISGDAGCKCDAGGGVQAEPWERSFTNGKKDLSGETANGSHPFCDQKKGVMPAGGKEG